MSPTDTAPLAGQGGDARDFDFAGATAVVTGAASGLGFALCHHLVGRGVRHLVLADVQADALAAAAASIEALGARILPYRLDVSRSDEVDALASATLQAFGAPHLVFNNAGVSAGGLVWENTARDWEWVLGVNLMGVVHGVRAFTPLMLARAARDPLYRGRLVNTASLAGLINAPNMGIYNVSKHAVVALSETLHQDLRLVTTQVGATVVCPDFVRTAIADSARNRPADLTNERAAMTRSQRLNRVMAARAVEEAVATPDDVAVAVLDAVRQGRFHVATPPADLAALRLRMDDLLQRRDPSDPFAARPKMMLDLQRALGGSRP